MKPKFETSNGVDQEKTKLISDVREFVESKGLHVFELSPEEGELYRVQILKEENINPIWGDEFNDLFEELKNIPGLASASIEISVDRSIPNATGVVHIVFKRKPRQIH